MIAVIFEAVPAQGRTAEYLDAAAELAPILSTMDGLVSIERFQSLTDPARLLSLSFWRDEAAVAAWRNTAAHRATQARGRAGVFADYRLRIAEVARDYGRTDRAQAPPDSRAVHACPWRGRAEPEPEPRLAQADAASAAPLAGPTSAPRTGSRRW